MRKGRGYENEASDRHAGQVNANVRWVHKGHLRTNLVAMVRHCTTEFAITSSIDEPDVTPNLQYMPRDAENAARKIDGGEVYIGDQSSEWKTRNQKEPGSRGERSHDGQMG